MWNPFFHFFGTPRFCRAPFEKHCFVDIWYDCFKSGLQNLHKVAEQRKIHTCVSWTGCNPVTSVIKLSLNQQLVPDYTESPKCEIMPINPVFQTCIVSLMMLVLYQMLCPCRQFCYLKTTKVTFCVCGCSLSLSKVNKIIKYGVLVTF